MKFLYLLLLATIIFSCKQNEVATPQPSESQKKFVDVDTTNNDVVHMSDMDDNYYSLDEVIAANKGKVIYLDIWASWCGPCKAQMPASHKLQEKYKNQDVTFLYVSIDVNNKAWEASAKQFDLLENSYLARNYPKAKLFQTHNVQSIPRYMLFDKNGRLIATDAARPSSDVISNNIDAFLSI